MMIGHEERGTMHLEIKRKRNVLHALCEAILKK